MAGVAVVRALGDLADAPFELKWPNDVMLRMTTGEASAPSWRKLAGILSEAATEGGTVRSIVIGIGINLRRSEAPPDVAARMIAIGDVLPPGWASTAALQAIVTSLLIRLREGTSMLAAGLAAEVRDEWKRRAPSVEGTHVRWRAQGATYEGRSAGIDDDGALRVRVGAVVRTIRAGDVDWLLEPGLA